MSDEQVASAPSGLSLDAMRDSISEKRKTDPLIAARVGSQEVVNRVFAAIRKDRQIHAETMLTALGALAGYACQAAVRAEYVDGRGMAEIAVFLIADNGDGKKWYFGDLMNKPLAESTYSVWNMAVAAARQQGASELVGVHELFGHVASTVGRERFGSLRVPDFHAPRQSAMELLKRLWPATFPVAEKLCVHPSEWPILFGAAVQAGMARVGKNLLDPSLAFSIVMESAIAMSKFHLTLDPASAGTKHVLPVMHPVVVPDAPSLGSAAGSAGIPVNIGFANLSGQDLAAMASEDAAALLPLFGRQRPFPFHGMPSAEVVFIYAHLNDDGTLKVPGVNYGIEQFARLTGAAIAVLASPNTGEIIQKAVALAAPASANLVFTIDRNGKGFAKFFRDLFAMMRDGTPMLQAWALLAPQIGKVNQANAPRTLMLAGRGNIAFAPATGAPSRT
jgi:hypothetical protein